jgi:hypothetical protein
MNARNLVRKLGLLVGLSLLVLVLLPRSAAATEGGQSVYVPGAYGNFGMGMVPGPGVYFNDYSYWYSGSATSKTLLNGHLELNATETEYVNTFEFTGVSPWKLFGGRYWGGVYIPFASASLNAGATLDAFGRTLARSVGASQGGMADWYVIPVGLAWDVGNFHISAFEGVNVPIGEYNPSNLVSLGHNYWAYDTNVAASYLNEKTGFTIGADAGYIINSINPATQYQSGQEFHLDVNIGQYLTETFGVGLVGYAYQQTTGDSGSGAILGPFQGTAYGIGPAVQGIVVFGKTPVVFEGEWIYQFGVVNQFAGNYVQVNISVQL